MTKQQTYNNAIVCPLFRRGRRHLALRERRARIGALALHKCAARGRRRDAHDASAAHLGAGRHSGVGRR